MDYLRMNFQDEAPAFGSGHRSVLVVSIGPKWVKLLEPASCAVETLPRHDARTAKGVSAGFDTIARGSTLIPYDAAKMARRLKTNAKAYGRESATVRDAIETLRRLA